MKKYDFKKELKNLYTASLKKMNIIDVPELNYLMVDGQGDPNKVSSFKEAVGTLYSISYNLKFYFKKEKGIDYSVMPLEGLWWMDDMTQFSQSKKDEWKWTMMIMQPHFIEKEDVLKKIEFVKKKSDFDGFPAVRFDKFNEGKCAQVLYLGPYSDEGPTIKKLHEFIFENGYSLRDKHHEIYLGDPRRSAPEKLKTIIRQPIK